IGGMSLNLFSAIGLLLLAGIVKKNAILLVDYAILVRKEHNLEAREAMLRAGPVLLRPILMTSIAMMMAVMPSAFGFGAGGEIRRPMAIGVLGGLIMSTSLSLLVVPSFYVCADWMQIRVGRLYRRIRPGHEEPAPVPPEAKPELVDLESRAG